MAARNFLAFDLGAESGRAVLGTLEGGRLTLEEKHRFANPIGRINGHLHWNLLAQWEELKTGLRKAAGDARGSGRALPIHGHRRRHLGRRLRPARPRRRRPRQPVPLPRLPHRRHHGARLRPRPARGHLRGHRHPVHAAQLALPAPRDAASSAASSSTPPRRCCSCPTCSTTSSPACARASSRSPPPARCTTRASARWATELLEKLGAADADPAGDRPLRHGARRRCGSDVAEECGVGRIPVIAPGCARHRQRRRRRPRGRRRRTTGATSAPARGR